MAQPISTSPALIANRAIIILLSSLLFQPCRSQLILSPEWNRFVDKGEDGPVYAIGTCAYQKGNYTAKSDFKSNLLNVFSNLTSAAVESKRLFYNISSGSGLDRVYGLFDCEAGLQSDACATCVHEARDKLLHTCISKEATIYYGNCMLRYANHMFFSISDLSPGFLNCDDWYPPLPDSENLYNIVSTTMERLIKQVSQDSIQHFAVEAPNLYADQKVYMLVQCRPDVSKPDCTDCLMRSLNGTTFCSSEGLIWSNLSRPICQMRYGFRHFYNLSLLGPSFDPPFSALPPPSSNSSSHTSTAADHRASTKLLFISIAITIFISEFTPFP